MESKIGEIFEYNGEWYQCVESDSCGECSLFTTECGSGTKSDLADKVFGQCSKVRRTDNKHVIFKKLEKVGEPYTTFVDKTVQNYLLETAVTVPPKDVFTLINNEQRLIAIEIKQNTEDMEEKGQCCDNRFEIIAKAKEALLKETNIARDEQEMAVIDNILFRCWQMGWLDKYDDTKHSNSGSIGKNLKPFSLEAAKTGKPVCTRDGAKARIICFDAKSDAPIIALITANDGTETTFDYLSDGTFFNSENPDNDLMMLPEKKEGWVNVYKDGLLGARVYKTRKEAYDIASPCDYVDTVKIEWEE